MSKNKDPVMVKALSEIDFLAQKGGLRRIAVGVSGGPDSMFLLHAIASCRDKFAEVVVAHVNHSLRRTGAPLDEKLVRETAAQFGFTFATRKVPVKELATALSQGIEEAAREARYAFFAELMISNDLDAVLIGHTLDDQIETLLLHFVRGSGLRGLSGMKEITELRLGNAVKPVRVVRPLLHIRKMDIVAYLDAQKIAYREDESNSDKDYTRNKVRHEIVPKLMEINPNLHQTLDRTRELIRSTHELDHEKAQSLLSAEELFKRKSQIEFELDKDVFLGYPVSTKRELMNILLNELTDLRDTVRYDHIESALKFVADGPSGHEIHLPSGVRLKQLSQSFVLTRAPDEPKRMPPRPFHLTIPARCETGDGVLEVERIDKASRHNELKGMALMGAVPSDEAVIDAQSVPSGLSIRPWKEGDAMIALGMKRKKKLQDIFVDAKVDRARRHIMPLVCHGEEIVWIPGVQLGESYKVTPQTSKIIWLRYQERGNNG